MSYSFYIKNTIPIDEVETFIASVFKKGKDQIGNLFEITDIKKEIYYEYDIMKRGFSTYLSIHGGSLSGKMDFIDKEIHLAYKFAKKFQTDVLVGIPDEVNPYLWWLINEHKELFLAKELLFDAHYEEDFIEIDYSSLTKLDRKIK